MSEPIPPPIPADTSTEYLARTSVLTRLSLFRIDGGVLTITPQNSEAKPGEPPAVPEAIPLSHVTELRLRFFPTRVQTNRYECLVRLRDGLVIKLTNEEYRGVLTFHDRSGEYVRFVRALSLAVAAANPAAKFLTGRPWLPQLLEWGFLAAMVALLAFVLLSVGKIELHSFVIVKALLVVAFIPLLVQYARKNRPRVYDPRAVPEQVLPPATSR